MPTAMLAWVFLLPGLLSETFEPKEGFLCVRVVYKNIVYLAQKVERSRLSGSVTIRLRAPEVDHKYDDLLGGPPPKPKSRSMTIKDFDSIADSQTCECSSLINCIDK